MVRGLSAVKIDVDHFLDGATEVREIFDVLAIFHNGALTAEDTAPHLHLRVKVHADFFDHGTLLITE